MKKLTLSSRERLKDPKTIAQLLQEGIALFSYPVKLVYLHIPYDGGPYRFGVTVPRRKIKKAVKRNTIKRRIREAFRLNKEIISTLGTEKNVTYALFAIYVANEEIDYRIIENSMKKILNNMVNNL
ncbi:MAG TPA: ribonuclease P protein component [Saprospiraceae bacterium]|nr:ribonuclease P protein component [Saprospiraceae bacterium]